MGDVENAQHAERQRQAKGNEEDDRGIGQRIDNERDGIQKHEFPSGAQKRPGPETAGPTNEA